jgi:hypothetical protein
MANKTSAKTSANPKPKTHTVTIEAIAPVAFAVPGIRKAFTGDSIIYHNKTGGPVKISVAADNVLQGVKKLTPKLVNNGKKRKFKVVAGEGTYEISVHYSYRDKKKNNKLRTGFALGASSPKIIIPRPGGR